MSKISKRSCPPGKIMRKSYKSASGKTVKARCIRKPGLLPGKSSERAQRSITKSKMRSMKAMRMSKKMGLRMRSRCKKNQTLRSGYNIRPYIRKVSGVNVRGSLVAPGCISKRGKSLKIHGEPTTRIVLDEEDHFLSEHGYFDIDTKTKEERHKALHKLITHFIPIKGQMATYNYVIRALNARYILNRNANPKIARIFKADQRAISAEYKKMKTM